MNKRAIFAVGLLALMLLTAWASRVFAPAAPAPVPPQLAAAAVPTVANSAPDGVATQAPTAAAQPAWLAITPDGSGHWLLGGRLPDERARQLVMARAQANFGPDSVLDQITVGPTIDARWLLGALLNFPPRLNPDDRVTLRLREDILDVSGSFGSEEAHKRAIASLSGPQFAGLVLSDSAQARVAPQLPPPALQADWNGERLRLDGRVADPQTRDMILARARSLYPAARVESAIELAEVAAPSWMPALARAFPPPLAQLRSASVRLEDGSLVFDGEAGQPVAHDLALSALAVALAGQVPIDDRLILAGGAADQPAPALAQAPTSAQEAVRDQAGAPSPEAGQAPSPAERLHAQGGPLNEDPLLAVTFYQGSARLTGAATRALDRLVATLEARPGGHFEIAGFTDDRGAPGPNLGLSEQRARAVAAYLSWRGIASGQLTINGYGAADPVADNASADGRRKNRRVEIRPLS